MSSGYSFDAESVRRISRGIRRIEGMPDQVQGFGASPVSGPGGAQVRTPATLPANYDGAQPLFGKLIDRDRDGNLVELADAYILGANNARLETNREYLGRMERVYNGPDGSAVLYRVQSVPSEGGHFATVHPLRIIQVNYEGADFPDPFKFKTLICVDQLKFFGGVNPFTPDNLNEFDRWLAPEWEDDRFYIPPREPGLPLYSVSMTSIDRTWRAPLGQSSRLEDLAYEVCRMISRTHCLEFKGYWRKSTAYFVNPVTGNKIYLYQYIQPSPNEWGGSDYTFWNAQPFLIPYLFTTTTFEGERYHLMRMNSYPRGGVGSSTWYLWFRDIFGVIPNISTTYDSSQQKYALVTPVNSYTLQSSWPFTSSAIGAGPAYVITNRVGPPTTTTTTTV